MKSRIINFDKLKFIRADKELNLIKISSKERENYEREFRKKGHYNGELTAVLKLVKRGDCLEVYLGKTKFFNALIAAKKFKPKPFLCINAIIEFNDSIIMIKRGKKVFGYPNYFDFPAGIVPFSETLKSWILNRIEEDTKIKRKNIKLHPLLNKAVIFENLWINFFYKAEYLGKSKALKKLTLVKKSKISHFLKNKVVFPEILKLFSS